LSYWAVIYSPATVLWYFGGLSLLEQLGVDDAMRGRDEQVVRPALEHVADIDHEGPLDRRRVDPLAGAIAHLQTADIILPEHGDAAPSS
jgi:hypothetical protein